MDKSAVEYKALTLLDSIRERKKSSSKALAEFLVEANAGLSVGLPDPQKAARQLAGQANSARGQSLLWLFQERPARRKLAQNGAPAELSRVTVEAWVQEVREAFEGIAPLMEPLEVVGPVGERVIALNVETDRAPFVVYTAAGRRTGKGKPANRAT